MKIDRLLEITIILLNRNNTTAKELADRFSVSTRTIYRDIDILSAAGVPVYANRGTHGGISLLDNYSLPKTIVSREESESILFSLKTLQMTKYPEIDKILEKLSALFRTASTDWIQIDFSPWGSNPNQYDKLTNIKNAILQCHVIEFDYIGASNIRSHRFLEPLRLIFKGQAWYLWGWSREREDFRTFRLSRMKALKVLDEKFDRAKKREPAQNENDIKAPAYELENSNVTLELKFKEKALYRIYDDYDDDIIQKNDDGTYSVTITFPEDDWVYGYIMSFGDNVEVISPKHIKEIVMSKAENMLKMYVSDKKE